MRGYFLVSKASAVVSKLKTNRLSLLNRLKNVPIDTILPFQQVSHLLGCFWLEIFSELVWHKGSITAELQVVTLM